MHGVRAFVDVVLLVMVRRGDVGRSTPVVCFFDVFRSVVAVRREGVVEAVRVRGGSSPWILRRNDDLFGVIHVRPSSFACSCTAEEPTGYRDVSDVGYLV